MPLTRPLKTLREGKVLGPAGLFCPNCDWPGAGRLSFFQSIVFVLFDDEYYAVATAQGSADVFLASVVLTYEIGVLQRIGATERGLYSVCNPLVIPLAIGLT